jgi:S-adenosylmethionine/arginine decarboxylase-like enzyme
MASHHFIGTGLLSERLAAAAPAPAQLVSRIKGFITASGLQVVADQAVRFENGGLTLVWILAESHLVIHYWATEGFATIDLHVCDYHESNAQNARRLVESLGSFCFEIGSDRWHELEVEHPPVTAGAPR